MKEKLTRNCPKCNTPFTYKTKQGYRAAIQFNKRCKRCTNTGRIYSDEVNKRKGRSGSKNAFFGKTHSKETIDKIKESIKNSTHYESCHSIEYIEKQRINSSGKNNPFYGKTHTKETREKMSRIKTEQIASGEFNITKNARGNKGWYTSTKTNARERYDSELELCRMKDLDSDINVVTWTKYHGIRIPYLFNDIVKNYVPDFLITYKNGIQTLEETKGYDPKTKYKKLALKKYCDEHNLIYSWLCQKDVKSYIEWRKN